MKAVLCVLACLALASAMPFGEFLGKYNKAYSFGELAHRQAVYEQTLLEISQINAQNLSWTAGVNEWSDLTWEEFQGRFLMAPQKCSATNPGHPMSGIKHEEGPNEDTFDWRDKGKVTAVKNQGSCGSCWAFSTIGAVESAVSIKSGQAPATYSEQQLVDCAGGFNNQGCRGGLPSQAFQYILWQGGIASSASYAYTGRDGKCRYNTSMPSAKITNGVNITEGSETELLDAIKTKGPVSVAYQVSGDFRSYKSGVYDSTQCKKGPMDVNHAVLAVGSGATEKPYYIIKNSWGLSFGIQGYFWMVRGKNMCGVATCAAYPVA
jgi:cathepsin H